MSGIPQYEAFASASAYEEGGGDMIKHSGDLFAYRLIDF